MVAQTVKNPPAMQDTWVWSVSQEDPLKKGMVTNSNIVAWKIPWTEGPGGLQPIGSRTVRLDWEANTSTFTKILYHDPFSGFRIKVMSRNIGFVTDATFL